MPETSFTNWSDFLKEWEQEALDILIPFQLIDPSNLTPVEQEFGSFGAMG